MAELFYNTTVMHSQTRRLEYILYESSEAAQDDRTTTTVTIIYLQIFEGASPYTGGGSVISVEVELLCVLYARY